MCCGLSWATTFSHWRRCAYAVAWAWCAHPQPACPTPYHLRPCRLRQPLRLIPASAGGRASVGRPSADFAVAGAGGLSCRLRATALGRAQNPPTPAHFQVSEHLQRFKPCGVEPFGVVVLIFWLGRSLPRPLSLHSAHQRTNPRIAELRSAVAKSGCIVAWLFCSLVGLSNCAPLRVSLDCISIYVMDHSALRAGCRPLLGRGCCSCR